MAQEKAQLIPRKTFFANPDKASPSLSRDGQRLGYVAPVDGVMNVWVANVGDIASAKPVTSDSRRGIRSYFWPYSSDHILYIQDRDGDENWHVYSVELSSGTERDLTPYEDVHAQILQLSPEHPEDALIAVNDRDAQLHDVYRYNITTGERELVEQNDIGAAEYITDHQLNVRLAVRMKQSGGNETLTRGEDGEWRVLISVGPEDDISTAPLSMNKAGTHLYLFDSRDRNTSALAMMNIESGEETLLAEDAKADPSGFVVHPLEASPQAVSFDYDRVRWQILDESIRPDMDYLHSLEHGDLNVESRSLDDRRWIVSYEVDNGPFRYYLYDKESRSAEFLFTNRQSLEGLELASMTPAVVTARDGLDLVCYYTLPTNTSGHKAASLSIPKQPMPTVVYVHGGPWARDSWGYDPVHQLLADRGYAVISANYRGSVGFGKDFLNAANYEWAAKMHDDLIDVVNWAIEQGISDPERTAIMGGSYGGYATLVGLTFTPETFACGVDIVGPSNLMTLLESIPPYWEPMKAVFRTRMGDMDTEEGRKMLTERSPLTHVQNIKRPLLIGQGANDPRVKQAEADQIVAAMNENGIPVTYALYPDEGHGFARPENNLSFMAITEAFLSRTLGGLLEPIGDAFDGSSVKILNGGDEIPGLDGVLVDAE
jgi:dipeptidyl aminopeptidase/acylaminoacyl peptidase